MTEAEFKHRTKQVALRVIRLVNTLPVSGVAGVIGKQLVRSGTSIGANYRAVCRGKSTADAVHKLAIVEEEADESLYWIELLIEAQIVSERKLASLTKEINEIVRMTVASIKTLRSKSVSAPRTSSNPKSKIQNEILDCTEHDSRRGSSGGDKTS
jgi:four helix bundle protein